MLIATGFVAGGAIMGVLDAIANAIIKGITGSTKAGSAIHILGEHALEGMAGEIAGLVGLVELCILIVTWSWRAKEA